MNAPFHADRIAFVGPFVGRKMRILVCGGRDYQDRTTVFAALDRCLQAMHILLKDADLYDIIDELRATFMPS